jgi:hypothetical protein
LRTTRSTFTPSTRWIDFSEDDGNQSPNAQNTG